MHGFKEGFTVREAYGLTAPTRWDYADWDPGKEEVDAALKIASEQMSRDLADKVELSRKYPARVGGTLMPDDAHTPHMTVKSADGADMALRAWATGKFFTHKIVVLDIMDRVSWAYRVFVDLDDRKVVQREWTPTEEDIAKARKIADLKMADLIPGNPKGLEIKSGGGEFDFGPTRRLLILSYTYATPDGLGLTGGSIYVDMDKGKIDEH